MDTRIREELTYLLGNGSGIVPSLELCILDDLFCIDIDRVVGENHKEVFGISVKRNRNTIVCLCVDGVGIYPVDVFNILFGDLGIL